MNEKVKRMSRYSIWLRHNYPNKETENPQFISIWAKGNGVKKQRKTRIKIPPLHWDTKSRNIKQEYRTQYRKQYSVIHQIEEDIVTQLELLEGGKITLETALDNLTNKRDKESTVVEFLNSRNNALKPSTMKTYKTNISAIESHLNSSLKVNQIIDRNEVQKIVKTLEDSRSLGNGVKAYVKTLRSIAKQFSDDVDINKVYEGLTPKGVETRKNPLDPTQVKLAINNINSIGQLTAYLLFLYSYCLKGITGKDIPNLDKDTLVSGTKNHPLTHYHTLGDFIQSEDPERPSFSNKVHYQLYRGKSGVAVEGLYNAFPILFIREWLHHCLSIDLPKYVYKGNDPIRLFNFYTKDKKGNVILESEKKWEDIRHSYRKKYNKIFKGDGTLHQTRHTYMDVMERLNVPLIDQKRQLSHKVSKEAIDNYAGIKGINNKQDKVQTDCIEEFGIVEILNILSKKFDKDYKGFGVSCWNQKVLLEGEVFKVLQGWTIDNQLWTNANEREYQSELEKLRFKGSTKLNEDGEVVTLEIKPEDYEGNLKRLYNLREESLRSKIKLKFVKPEKTNSIWFEFEEPEWFKEARKKREEELKKLKEKGLKEEIKLKDYFKKKKV